VTQQAPGSRFGGGRTAYPLSVLAFGELDRNPPARPGPVSSLSEHAEDELVHFHRRARP
jgi:hypothetical protein